ncbi:kinase-like domain-containing protein, partial [Cristinia sonorae]
FCRESLLWSKLQHKHVLPFIGVSKDVFSRGMICMILPLMEAGNIRRRISTTDPGKQLTSTTFEAHVALGLAYLHDHGVVHGDLHGGNILIDADDHALLTDFGFSVIAEATAGAYGSKHGGAAQHFMAPELWDPDEFGLTHARYTPATDAYGFGCTCIELYTGKMPFAGPKMTAFKISMKVLDGKRPPRPSTPFDTPMSDRMWAVVEASWAQQPGERLKAADIAKSMEAFV